MGIRLHKKSNVYMAFDDGDRFGVEADKNSQTGFYHILEWMIYALLMNGEQDKLDQIIKEQQAKLATVRQNTKE